MKGTIFYWKNESTGEQINLDDMSKSDLKESLKEMIKRDSLGQESNSKYDLKSDKSQFSESMLDQSIEEDTDNPY